MNRLAPCEPEDYENWGFPYCQHMAARASWGVMTSQSRPLQVELQLKERDPPAGWLRAGGNRRQRFDGWLQLIGSLEAVLSGGDAAEAPDPRAVRSRPEGERST